MNLLTEEQIEEQLRTLATEWHLTHENKLRRAYAFKNFPTAVEFIKALTKITEALDHHPNIQVDYNIVTLHLWTHRVSGLTTKDFELAQKIDGLT
jgi:4a-hydroxytetrahydrobiopterin dehydratase